MSELGNKQVFAKNLQRYMDKENIDRYKLCKDLNFKYSTVSEWLAAKKYPRIDKIEILANYFNILKSDLIEEPKITDDTNNVCTILSEFREDNSGCSISLSEHEKRLISAYRDKPEMQPAVDKLLGIDSAPAKNIGEDIAETVINTQNALNTRCNSISK